MLGLFLLGSQVGRYTHELNYPTHDLEITIVVHALVRWQHFLLGHHFELHLDNQSL